MNKKNNNGEKKFFYLFVACLTLSIIIIGATFAYFTAGIRNNDTVRGATETTGFNLSISKVTSLDLTYGLIPMRNTEAPYAAEQLCEDDNDRIGPFYVKCPVSSLSGYIQRYNGTNYNVGK